MHVSVTRAQLRFQTMLDISSTVLLLLLQLHISISEITCPTVKRSVAVCCATALLAQQQQDLQLKLQLPLANAATLVQACQPELMCDCIQ
jgi:hypothetical protein